MDAEQDGFRKKHSTTHSVLRLVQPIYKSMEKGEATAAATHIQNHGER